jgi:hypothetical protein
VKIQPVLNPNDEPMPRRTRGRPPKNCNVNPFQIAQSDLSQPQGSHSVPSNSTNQADIGESNSTEAPFNLRPFESLDPNGDQALHDILQDQLSLAADESVHHVEANASLNQNRDVTSSQPEFGLRDLGTGGMRIKLEHNENPGLTEHHLELIYQTENGKLFCILCAYVSSTLLCMPGDFNIIHIPLDAHEFLRRLSRFITGLPIKSFLNTAIYTILTRAPSSL